jgi:hypothetical protein
MSEPQADEITELIRLGVAGKGPEWNRLQGKLFTAIERITARIGEWADEPSGQSRAADMGEMLKDLTSLATDWARAKVERPSLENALIRVDIVAKFAEAKKAMSEARKAEAEAIGTDLDNLERIIKFAELLGRVRVAKVGKDLHLSCGVDPRQLGEPAGDAETADSQIN